MVGKTSDVGPEGQRVPGVDHHRDDRHDGKERSFRDKLRHPFPELRDKLKDTHLYDVKVGAIHMKHRIGKFQNLVNTNHRHDEEHEKATDAKRTNIAEGHRFQSFAPERDGNRIKWYIDGRDYYHAVSIALERAKETIYIADWWLSPELFLRRPPHFNKEWRLDKILKRAAERGVKIYIIVYKEVSQALTCNSAHTKHALAALCPEGTPGHGNIVCMRHPDHNVFENAGDMTFYWAHHEKFIVIDYNLAFIGGLDLCFGRWDNTVHALADVHPAGVENEVWPGQDFNNNRIMDFQSVEDWKSNELSKAEYGRMPWHDVAMGVIGPCVYDIAEHFVLRWNFVKRDKYKRDERYDWLTMTGRTGENEDLVGVQRPKHPVGEYVHHPLSPLESKTGNPNQVRGTQRKLGNVLDQDGHPEDEFHDAHEDLELDEHGYRPDQHRHGHGFEKELQQRGYHLPHLHKDKSNTGDPENVNAEISKQENTHMTGNDPEKEGTVTASGGVAEKSKGYASSAVGDPSDDQHGHVGQGTVHAQVVRSSADWSSGILTEQSIQNAYCQVIRAAKHFVYIENQFFITATGEKQAPVHNLIGAAIVDAVVKAHEEGRKFRVIIMIPAIPGFAGDLRDDAAAGTRAIMDYQYKSLNRGEESIFGRVRAAGVDPNKFIFCFNLRSYDRLNKTPAVKQQEEASGVKYQEVQRAQAEEVMSSGVHGAHGEGSSSDGEGDSDSEGERQKQHMKERKKKFEDRKGEVGLSGDSGDPKVLSGDSIAKDAMLGEPNPSEETWAGRSSDPSENKEEDREQEKENFVQEELYIHGKILIVDDRIVICGSSNINDRSQLGFHDSELSIVMEDTLPLESKMSGQDFVAGHHAATLRRMLWREHLGLLPAQSLDAGDDINALPPEDGDNDWKQGDEYDALVEDPLSDDLWEMWTSRATTNTNVFRHLFHADPDDNIKTFHDYESFLPKGRKAGHLFDMYQPVDIVRQELDKIKGHLVWFPLDFLKDAEMAEKGLQVNSYTESIYT
ncbi:phospholipase D/nuclease [Polychaeton citri CBS 116435]|uniref:Phospholipase n=1 Tax=Polychaeton citri CBS 116435 TaxID=1314669 RepID=A0A9P4Q2D5_9PEZI|nr:phospholipase D/nuclease [Polychaeton citri CBS 116435]